MYNLIGHQFSRLTVLQRVGKVGMQITWLCRCICGTEKVIKSYNLRSGSTKSCGCLSREFLRGVAVKGRKYSLDEHVFDVIDTPEKAYWLGMLYTDGNVCGKYLQLELKDWELINKFVKFLKSDYYIAKTGKNKQYRKVTIWTPYLSQYILPKYGIIPRKTYDHSVPVFIPGGDLERHFWRGCMDGDGKIGKIYSTVVVTHTTTGKQSVYYGCIATISLSNLNICFLLKFGQFIGHGHLDEGVTKVKGKPFKSCQWVYNSSPRRISPVLDLLYESSTEFTRLSRKYHRYSKIKNFYR